MNSLQSIVWDFKMDKKEAIPMMSPNLFEFRFDFSDTQFARTPWEFQDANAYI